MTFSIGFDAAGYDEMHYARIAAKQFGTDHHEYYVTPDDLVERIPRCRGLLRPAVRQLVGIAGLLLREARARPRGHPDARRRRRRRALRRQLALRDRQAVHRLRARARHPEAIADRAVCAGSATARDSGAAQRRALRRNRAHARSGTTATLQSADPDGSRNGLHPGFPRPGRHRRTASARAGDLCRHPLGGHAEPHVGVRVEVHIGR